LRQQEVSEDGDRLRLSEQTVGSIWRDTDQRRASQKMESWACHSSADLLAKT
jgi:hypothetical protein